MAGRQYQIAKAGWMHRLSTVLKRWKKGWFVLYDNGDLKYFDSPNSHTPEESIVMRAECTQILQGKQVDCGVAPPEGRKNEHLLRLNLRNGCMILCAEDNDDMKTWQLLLDDARTLRAPQPSHVNYGAPPPYPGQASAPPQNVIYAPPARPPMPPYTPYTTTQVVYPQQQTSYSYPGQVIYGTNPPTYIQPNTTTVIYADRPGYRRRHGLNGNLATGFVAGAAVGTMMWSPMLFW